MGLMPAHFDATFVFFSNGSSDPHPGRTSSLDVSRLTNSRFRGVSASAQSSHLTWWSVPLSAHSSQPHQPQPRSRFPNLQITSSATGPYLNRSTAPDLYEIHRVGVTTHLITKILILEASFHLIKQAATSLLPSALALL